MKRILVADDEEGIRSFLAEALEMEPDVRVDLAEDGLSALSALRTKMYDLLISDLNMPGMDGMTLIRTIKREQPDLEIVVLTAHGTIPTAVEAMRLGAFDFICKPLGSLEELRRLADSAIDRAVIRRKRQENQQGRSGEIDFIVNDKVMKDVLAKINKVAPTDATVLIVGESGTGKEIAARSIHRASPRAAAPFVAVNCAALPEDLLESELFGHEKGAFTGAVGRKTGRFEIARGGSLFLDEVAEMNPRVQAKLLRVLQERCFERLGGTRTINIDVRLIAATNKNLVLAQENGTFRGDLYHRLAVFPIHMPPLRERIMDIRPLAEHFLATARANLGRPSLSFSRQAVAALLRHSWPGNVRELANVVERAAILCGGNEIGIEDLMLQAGAPTGNPQDSPGILDGTLKEIEKKAIRNALAAEGGHRKRTAQRLGIALRTLYDKLKEYGL